MGESRRKVVRSADARDSSRWEGTQHNVALEVVRYDSSIRASEGPLAGGPPRGECCERFPGELGHEIVLEERHVDVPSPKRPPQLAHEQPFACNHVPGDHFTVEPVTIESGDVTADDRVDRQSHVDC
jgi:hypothetical protein